MGKWDFLRGTYSKMPLESSYVERLDAVLNAPAYAEGGLKVRELSDRELKDFYLHHRDELDKLNEQAKRYGLVVEACTRLFVERFEEQGESNVKFDDGVSLGHSVEPYPFVKDQSALLAWVKAHGLEAMLTLNYQTMASLVKERLEGKVNEPLPDGVDVYMKDKLSCRGRKNERPNNKGRSADAD